MKKLIFSILLVSVSLPAISDLIFFGSLSEPSAAELFSLPYLQKKKTRLKKPQSAKKAQKKQEAKDAKLKRDYEKFLKENRKRSLEIQTPEVRERMKQNVRDADANYKAKKKSSVARTKKGAKKYRR